MLNFLENHSVNYAFTSGILLTVLLVVVILLIVVTLRLIEAKKTIKKENFYSNLSMQTVNDYEIGIQLQELKIIELKKAFEDAVAEITELRCKVKNYANNDAALSDRMSELKEELRKSNILIEEQKAGLIDYYEKFTYWKERALHQKHSNPVKQIESEWYECISDNMVSFVKGVKYKDSGRKTLDALVWLENDGHTYLTHKSNFKPVVK